LCHRGIVDDPAQIQLTHRSAIHLSIHLPNTPYVTQQHLHESHTVCPPRKPPSLTHTYEYTYLGLFNLHPRDRNTCRSYVLIDTDAHSRIVLSIRYALALPTPAFLLGGRTIYIPRTGDFFSNQQLRSTEWFIFSSSLGNPSTAQLGTLGNKISTPSRSEKFFLNPHSPKSAERRMSCFFSLPRNGSNVIFCSGLHRSKNAHWQFR